MHLLQCDSRVGKQTTHLLVSGLDLGKGRRRSVEEGEEVNDVLLDGLRDRGEGLEGLRLVSGSFSNTLLLGVLLCGRIEAEVSSSGLGNRVFLEQRPCRSEGELLLLPKATWDALQLSRDH